MIKAWDVILRFALGICAALVACTSAQAAITCSISSNGFASAYVPAATATNITSTSFTMSCQRSVGSDPTTFAYTVTVNNGIHPNSYNGVTYNQAAYGSNRMWYSNFTTSNCSSFWTGITTIGGTITFSSAADFATKTNTQPFWGCILKQQTEAAGTYTDTVTMTPSRGSPATFPVSIETPSTCSLSSPPSSMTFNYVAFQSTAASATSNFSATCTNLLPYGMTLDASSSVLVGLAYTLSLSVSSSVGTGIAQAYTVSGSMAAGQSGACTTGSCSGTEARTLTITY